MNTVKNKFNIFRILLLISGFLLLGWYNSASAALVSVSGAISTNITWDAANTYQVTSSITLNAGYTLTIPAGTFVKFNPGTSMIVYGNLQAIGTALNPIYFTSRDDDSIGEIVTGSDGNPVRWDWSKIDMRTWSSNSVLDHVLIKYPQYGIYTYNITNFTLKNSTITETLTYGIYYSSANGISTVSGNTISNGSGWGIYIYYWGAQIITNNTILNNIGKWLECTQQATVFTGNSLSGNWKPSKFCNLDPFLEWNPTNTTYLDSWSYYEIYSFSINETTWTLPKLSWPIFLYVGGLDLWKTLTIAPGNILRINNGSSITIYWNLQAIGTVSEPIIFTSRDDDTAGGPIPWISDWVPVKWDWSMIYMRDWTSGSAFENVVIKYPQYGIFTANITNFTLKNSTITETLTYGIYYSSANGISTVSGNTISNGSGWGIYIYYWGAQKIINNTIVKNTWVWISLWNSTSTIKNNISYGNSYGIQCTVSVPLTITYNLFYNNTSGTQNGTLCTIWATTNKTTEDPLFVDYTNKNYRLQSTSPAINTWDPTMWNHPLSGDRYDIWAYEYYIAGVTRISGATISNPDWKTLEYTWSFTGWVDKPGFIWAYTGTTSDISKIVSCNYTIKYKWDYRLKLSLSESGSIVKESDYWFTVQ